MSTIHTIYRNISSLVQEQERVVSSLGSEISHVETARDAAKQAVATATKALVVTGDDERYAALTRALQAAGGKYNFTATVQDWTKQDAVNRQEKAELETKWGSLKDVSQKSSALGNEISEIAIALNQISPELEKFDHTIRAIDTHNKKYPKAPITEENHDDFEKFKFGRWCMHVVTFGHHAPYKAYQIISAYDKEYGDLYEDAKSVAANRENERQLKETKSTKQVSKGDLDRVVQRINTLDNSYRGPEGIARSIRGTVSEQVMSNKAFSQALLNEVTVAAALDAVVAGAQFRSYALLDSTLATPYNYATATLESLQDPLDELSRANNVVGDESVHFDVSGLEGQLDNAARMTRNIILSAATAREAMAHYHAAEDASLATIEQDLARLANIETPNNRLEFDFYSLKNAVNNEVRAYEAEQERLEQIRLAAIAAAEEQRQRELAAARRAAAEEEERIAATSRSSNEISIGGSFQKSSDGGSEDVGTGNSDIQDNPSEEISSGNDGIDEPSP